MLYDTWLGEAYAPLPDEPLATCSRCAMAVHEPLELRDTGAYLPDLKCCTYFPFLPNFTVGALFEESRTNRDLGIRLSEAVQRGRLLPLGLLESPQQKKKREALGTEAYGRNKSLLCSFYVSTNGNCSIWKNRSGACANYVCRSVAGIQGLEFWEKRKKLIDRFEKTMVAEVLRRMGFTEDQFRFIERAKTAFKPEPVERAWGAHLGREMEFFELAWATARLISPAEVLELMGIDAHSQQQALTIERVTLFGR